MDIEATVAEVVERPTLKVTVFGPPPLLVANPIELIETVPEKADAV